MKFLYLDTETTGVNSRQHGVIQLAAIAEIDGELKGEFNEFIRPFPGDVIDDRALEVNKTTREELAAFQEPEKCFNLFLNFLNSFVDPYNPQDKFFFIAYNALFDWDFLKQFFIKNNHQFFNSYFFFPPLDIMYLAADYLKEKRPFMKNFKLETVSREIGLNPASQTFHDALYDVKITRDIYQIIQGLETEKQNAETSYPETLF
jgi:DNA polymerase III epsilon subunit-like protein